MTRKIFSLSILNLKMGGPGSNFFLSIFLGFFLSKCFVLFLFTFFVVFGQFFVVKCSLNTLYLIISITYIYRSPEFDLAAACLNNMQLQKVKVLQLQKWIPAVSEMFCSCRNRFPADAENDSCSCRNQFLQLQKSISPDAVLYNQFFLPRICLSLCLFVFFIDLISVDLWDFSSHLNKNISIMLVQTIHHSKVAICLTWMV